MTDHSAPSSANGGPRKLPLTHKTEWYRYWHEAGFKVMPFSERIIDGQKPEKPREMTPQEVEQHWCEYPDDELACVGGAYVGLRTRTEAGAAALWNMQIEHGLPPIITVFGGDATTLILAIDPEAVEAARSLPPLHSADGIQVQLFDTDPLPSAPGYVVVYSGEAAADLHVVDGDAIGTIRAYNSSLPTDTDLISEVPIDPHHPLEKFSITNRAAELRKQLADTSYVLQDIALRGQATVLFAEPNTGKTLITLFLVNQAIASGRVAPASIHYINVDDNAAGLVEKLEVAERFGFHVIAEGYCAGEDDKPFTAGDLPATIDQLIEQGLAAVSILILDTAKRFVDVMDKRQSAAFTKKVRAFTMKGGTVILLAHTNKNRDAAGRLVYGGTSDLRDDLDCAYLIDIVADQAKTTRRTVKFENIKRRGDVASTVFFSYSTERGLTYDELLASVQLVDEYGAALAVEEATFQTDTPVIRVVAELIGEGKVMRMALVREGAVRGGVSQNRVIEVLDRYHGADPSRHWWTFSVGARGAKIYRMIRELPPETDS